MKALTGTTSASSEENIADKSLAIIRSADTSTVSGNVAQSSAVEGSSRLYENGERRFVPMPTSDPKDPLNLPEWRKVMIIAALCFFGAMALAAENIIAALLPVFILEYNGITPHVLDYLKGLPQAKGGGVNANPIGLLSGLQGPPIWKITLISTLPTLVIGVSNYLLVPLSVAVGRRPVIIVCGLLAWCGALWAGASTSLESHLGARALQALGAGTVETLIPLVVQDMVFIHWRNRAFSAIWAAQGIIIVTLGICSPPIIIATSWRWLYRITAIAASISWGIILFVLPETRYFRSNAELRGEPLEPLPRGFLRPPLNPTRHGVRTWWTELGMFHYGISWPKAWDSFLASVKSFFFPNIFWIICLNGAFSAISLAAGQTGSSVLLTEPNSWPFRLIGLAVLPIVIASVFVALFAGYGADKLSNRITRGTRYGGRREPEVHLLNLIVPLFFAIAGCVMFGAGGSFIGHISWAVFVVGIGFLSFGVLATNVICAVYAVEAYPDWAAPVLVNSGAFRNIIGFGFSFKVVDWINELGFMRMFGIYAGVVAIVGVAGIPVFVYGKDIRKYFGQFVRAHEERYGNERLPGRDVKSHTRDDSHNRVSSNTEKTADIDTNTNTKTHENVETAPAPNESQPQSGKTTDNSKKGTGNGRGIDWEKVKEYLNMRSSWGDPAMH